MRSESLAGRGIGEDPDAPGAYAFIAEHGNDLRVAYVGQTSHLWTVTKGRLPRAGRG